LLTAQSLAWLVREAAEEINTSADPSRSAWDTQIDGGDWEVWRTANGLMAQDELALAGKHDTGVKPLGYVGSTKRDPVESLTVQIWFGLYCFPPAIRREFTQRCAVLQMLMFRLRRETLATEVGHVFSLLSL
jgi:hypothetical protein